MSEHKHEGLESYANNPGQVSPTAGPKEDDASEISTRKNPNQNRAHNAPAIPVKGSRPVDGYFIDRNTPMSPEAQEIKYPTLEEFETDVKDLI